MPDQSYKPGDRASRTGVYIVTHRTHRLSHLALLEEGETFPACHKCGGDVRFALHLRVKHLEADRDFRRGARLVPIRVGMPA